MTVMDFVGWPLDTQYRHRMHRVAGGAVSACIAELSDAGFYRYTPAEDTERARLVPAESFEGYGYLFEYTNREAISDSEDINEGVRFTSWKTFATSHPVLRSSALLFGKNIRIVLMSLSSRTFIAGSGTGLSLQSTHIRIGCCH